MPGGDLESPASKCRAKRSDLDRVVVVDHVGGETVHPREGELRIGVAIELADRLLSLNRPWGLVSPFPG
ncbi:MAG: hypothetical protein JWM85_1596 [Acidimicrobiaceae bacterium]|nr:hypothetical protein [Acidimicrobiaceae bacterium]